jgi:hypothetical protein
LLAPRPTPKLEDHPSLAVRGCLINLFTATLHIGGRSSIRNLRTRHAMVTGTHIHGLCGPTCDKVHPVVALYKVHPVVALYKVHRVVALYKVHPVVALYKVHPVVALYKCKWQSP